MAIHSPNLVSTLKGAAPVIQNGLLSLGKGVWNGLSQLSDAYYKPIAGHYDPTAKDSPSYSPVNFMNDLYKPGDDYSVTSGQNTPLDSITPSSAPQAANIPVNPRTIDYINADLAKHYGMDVSTAYQEALSNTSYQRAVKDMQSAGLNPAVMLSSGSGAGGVSGAAVAANGTGGGHGGAGNSAKSVFNSDVINGVSGIIGLISSAVAPGSGAAASSAASSIMKIINGVTK